MFCFDNTFSTISEKVIFFELILDNMGEDGQDEEDWKKYVTGTDLLDMKLEDILVSIWFFILFNVSIWKKTLSLSHSALVCCVILECIPVPYIAFTNTGSPAPWISCLHTETWKIFSE